MAIPKRTCAAVWTAALLLAGCDSSPEAPSNAGVCWRLVQGTDGKVDFKPVSTDAHNLETCGAHLEAVAMREHSGELAGAYQGMFVFIKPQMIQTSTHLDGARFRLFDQDTRAKIDRDLRWMLQDEAHSSQFAPKGADVSPSSPPPAPPR